jgi:hypothetical protein
LRKSKKSLSYEQVEAKKRKGVQFLRDIVGDDDRADDLEDESVSSYADRKHITISNSPQRRTNFMPSGNGGNGDTLTKAELQDCIDQAVQILQDAYQPESSREDLAGAVGNALDVLEGNGDEDEDDDGDDDDNGPR